MVTEVSIANMALSHLGGRGRIASLTEASEEARLANLHFAPARDEVLRAAPWPFAAKRKALAREAAAPVRDWGFAFEFPSDCLAPRHLLPSSRGEAPPPFEAAVSETLDRRLIFADVADPVLVYTARVTDPSLFDPLFASALAFRLAAYLAVPLSGRVELGAAMAGFYARVVDEAVAACLGEAKPQQPGDAEWIRARG